MLGKDPHKISILLLFFNFLKRLTFKPLDTY